MPNSPTPELKPCPFCLEPSEPPRFTIEDGDPKVTCFDCGTYMKSPDAVKDWNTRADNKELNDARRELELRKFEGFCAPELIMVKKESIELQKSNAVMREALREIGLTAHCISKAGPLTTPTLGEAWNKFDKISCMATHAVALSKQPPTTSILNES